MNYIRKFMEDNNLVEMQMFKIKNLVSIYYFKNNNLYNEHGTKCLYMLSLLLSEKAKILTPILDDKEREYLKAVIKPFRNSITYISKNTSYTGDTEFIFIKLNNNSDMNLPKFKENTMYKGMETNEEYTLKELEL